MNEDYTAPFYVPYEMAKRLGHNRPFYLPALEPEEREVLPQAIKKPARHLVTKPLIRKNEYRDITT